MSRRMWVEKAVQDEGVLDSTFLHSMQYINMWHCMSRKMLVESAMQEEGVDDPLLLHSMWYINV